VAGRANSTKIKIKIKIMHKIAIITGRDLYEGGNYDYYDTIKIIDTITAWEEVDDATFELLSAASRQGKFKILEQPTDPRAFIAKTVADHIKQIENQKREEEKQKAAADARKAESARKRQEKAILKLAKDADAEKALLATLLKKHPELAKTA
jgi:hypothetical protein